MKPINFKGLGTKAIGMAGGIAATKFAKEGVAKLGLTGLMANVAVIAAGALIPDLLGKKSALITTGGDAMMVLGMKDLMHEYFPSIAGIDDIAGMSDVSGPYGEGDYEVGDVDEQGIVSGADEDEQVGNSL